MRNPLKTIAAKVGVFVLGGVVSGGLWAVDHVKKVGGCGLKCKSDQFCELQSGSGVFGLDYGYQCKPKPAPSPSPEESR